MTSHIETFLRSCAKVHDTGSAVPETSYYPALDVLLSAIGSELSPAVYSVTQVSGKGAPGSKNSGIPDLGLFSDSLATAALDRNLDRSERLPEHGVVEVKPPEAALDQIAKSGQVRKYLDRYGKVILTNLREWRQTHRERPNRPGCGRGCVLESRSIPILNFSGNQPRDRCVPPRSAVRWRIGITS